jgi:hypothetical protein
MTILGAVASDEAVFLAADSLEFDDNGYFTTDAVKIAELSVACGTVGIGWAGSSDVGHRLIKAVGGAARENWDVLTGTASAHSCVLNYPRIDHHLIGASLLLAGFINDEPRVVVINPFGIVQRAREGAQFTGMYASNAWDLWHSQSNETNHGLRLKWALDQITSDRYGVAKPVRLWIIPKGERFAEVVI